MSELRKILHVEDDPDIQEIVSICLGTLGGFELLQCLTGQEALDKIAAFGPDLLMLDMMMPGMNGLETLDALRALPEFKDVPAIFVTSVNTADAYRDVIAEKALGAIQKPFDPMTLADQVKTLWDTKSG